MNNAPEVSTKHISINQQDILLVCVKYGLNKIGVCNIDMNSKRKNRCFFTGTEAVLTLSCYNPDDKYEDLMVVQSSNMPPQGTIRNLLTEAKEKLQEGLPPELALLSLFEHLADGIYAVKKHESYPTDGDGNFFWNAYGLLHQVKGTSRLNTVINPDKPYSAPYLIPSKSSVDYTHRQAKAASDFSKQKKEYLGISYHIGGMFSVLLKGHYAATAAAADRQPFMTYQIQPVKDLWFEEDEETKNQINKGFSSASYRIPFEFLSKEQIESVLITRKYPYPSFYQELKRKINKDKPVVSNKKIPSALSEIAEIYPDMEMISSAQGIDNLTKQELDALLMGQTELEGKTIIFTNYYSSLVAACNYLLYHNQDDFIEFALNIMKNPDLAATYNYVTGRLTKFFNPKIRAFFNDILLSTDSYYENIKHTAEKYIEDYDKFNSEEENSFYTSKLSSRITQSLNKPINREQLTPELTQSIADHVATMVK